MDAFAPNPPEWTNKAIHAYQFYCPSCHSSSRESVAVWLNRRSPVITENHRRKWQEFYHCHCGYVWWAWSCDRPPTNLSNQPDNHPT
ncbi:hypothetical protein [Cylindrospermum sp. FACHB-282]|uniref:hypothetical protein n=1 Tax=Cylindrospermum sp. FACHB-282 TaxID=2692794 RepID=UPI001688BC50|nr:hypothetical protein [Cylindrospermum sp. FACHB-282]MBD2386298.1 hypothetical protein [Cylindrospermum sp. FACHB-282]